MQDDAWILERTAQGTWIHGEVFARFADRDPDRWRQIVGYRVRPADARWGEGVIQSVSWGSCCEHVPDYLQIKTRYHTGWIAVASSDTWQRHHRAVCVSDEVASAIRECLADGLDRDERDVCLSRYSRLWRDRRDQELLDRAARMKRRLHEE